MTPNTYKILSRLVEEGIDYGYNRAYKYEDNPDSQVIKDQIYSSVMNQICEYFDFHTQND